MVCASKGAHACPQKPVQKSRSGIAAERLRSPSVSAPHWESLARPTGPGLLTYLIVPKVPKVPIRACAVSVSVSAVCLCIPHGVKRRSQKAAKRRRCHRHPRRHTVSHRPRRDSREHERAPRRHPPTGHRSPRPHTRPLTPPHTSAAPYGLDDSTRTRHTLVTPSGTPPPTTGGCAPLAWQRSAPLPHCVGSRVEPSGAHLPRAHHSRPSDHLTLSRALSLARSRRQRIGRGSALAPPP